MGSGDDIESGRTTTGESTTVLLGATPSEQDVNFNGTVILAVGPQEGSLHPKGTLDGIIGRGSNPAMPPGIKGGIGITGEGGSNQGTGVLGNGGGGGTGVEANGGDGGQVDSGIDQAGIGLRARGGKFDTDSISATDRSPHGPGVVASAGDSKIPKLSELGNVGVFGQGGNEVDETKNMGGPNFVVGPDFAGAGVVGRGGITRGNNPEVPNGPVIDTGGRSAGVVGLAGGLSMPKPEDYSRAGVFGISDTGAGVSGVADSGIGVKGASTTGPGVSGVNLSSDPANSGAGVEGFATVDRGGVFTSKKVAQLRLVPLQQPPSQIAGLEGDLLATIDKDNLLSLWFCRRAGDPGTVDWVRLG